MDLPAFDTRPNNPLYGPLSMWLAGDNPLDPTERPETMVDLAEALGVPVSKLVSIRSSKGFRRFHTDHTSNLDEIVTRRQEMLESLYLMGLEGNIQAAGAYLTHTKNAEALAAAGKIDPKALSVDDATQLSDEDLAKLLEQQS